MNLENFTEVRCRLSANSLFQSLISTVQYPSTDTVERTTIHLCSLVTARPFKETSLTESTMGTVGVILEVCN